ncbi:MAG: LOG family protein [Bacteroidota bacterium]
MSRPAALPGVASSDRLVGVVGSASPTAPADILASANALGRRLAEIDVPILTGGNAYGAVGALTDGARSLGGTVVGVAPRSLQAGSTHQGLDRLYRVGDIPARIAAFSDWTVQVLVLPGGLGTCEELFCLAGEVNRRSDAPALTIVDFNQRWTPLITAISELQSGGFISSHHRFGNHLCRTVEEVVDAVLATQARVDARRKR